jgi:Flp pilus assembly protein TadG
MTRIRFGEALTAIGAIALFVLLFGIVRMTNASYAGEKGEKGAAEATK